MKSVLMEVDKMSLKLKANGLNTSDLMMYHCGYEECEASHSFGPAVRDHFLIHYILSGKGTFYANNNIHTLEKGQGFLICPDAVTYYEADEIDPWTYCWVGFHGLKAAKYLESAQLNENSPIFTASHHEYTVQCFNQMLESKNLRFGRELRLLGNLYTFLSELIEINSGSLVPAGREDRSKEYITQAIRYIEMNYSYKINVTDIARHIGLDRSYLCRLFKETLSISPQKFLIDYRMNKAIELMQNPHLSLGDISRSVGYNDALSFSKTFSKSKGMAPSYYQQQLLSNL